MSPANLHRTAGLFVLVIFALLFSPLTGAQWSAQPGETNRNAFGPLRGDKASVCRGACGAGCPNTCTEEVSYECVDSTRLRRVTTYECGTHEGCREHDDCLDACTQTGRDNMECKTECHEEAVERFGFETATAWATGRGPSDGPPITFAYTRDAPSFPEAAFRCPDEARLACDGAAGRCVAAGGSTVDPVFDSYLSEGTGAMSISEFRAGRLCEGRVCEETADIRVTGQDSCERSGGAARCTRYGLEFDYRNADPSVPLECVASTSGGTGDFVGDMLVKGLSMMPEQEAGSGQGEGDDDGMRQLMGLFQKVVTSANSPEDVRISMAPLGPDGKPVEEMRVGTPADAGPQSIPRVIDLAAPSGHLVVPMYEIADGDETVTREIRCSHKGIPVLETTFRLTF